MIVGRRRSTFAETVRGAKKRRSSSLFDRASASQRALALTLFLCAACSAPAQDPNAARLVSGTDLLAKTLKPSPESRVQFSGHQTYPDAELRVAIGEQIREIDEQGVTPARADDAAYYVGAFYRKAGFSKVETSYQISGKGVVVKIVEGPRTLLRKVTFTGNLSIPTAKLFDYMIGAPEERLTREPDLFPYHEAEIAAGADRVRGLYVSEGYLDVLVEPAGLRLYEGGTRAEVIIKIVEGRRYTFGQIVFAGETLFSRDALIKAAGALGESIGSPFSATQVTNMTRNLQSFYKAHGYFTAEVSVDADPKKAVRGQVPVTFTAHPGPLYRFDSVTVENRTKPRPRLRPRFLPRRFRHLTGQVYSPEKLDETFREMMRTNLFTSLRLNLVALPDHTVRIDLTAEEAKAKEIGFTLGFNTYEGGSVGLRLADRNLLGNGRPLTFSADYSQRGLKAELVYADPWFLETRVRVSPRIFSIVRQEIGYTKEAAGARVDVSKHLLPHLELTAFVEQQSVTITEATIDPLLLGPTDYSYASIGLTQSTDFRDDPLNTTRGWIFTSSVEAAAVDGAQSFSRSTMRFSWYQPVGKRCLLALGARGGYIVPVAESIPIDVRFFNGGSTTVRSFPERELGPKDKNGNPVGGEFFSVLNAEFNFPVYGALQGAAFVDAGNLKGRGEVGVSDMRYAVGLGLRYKLPVGPLRLDYGYNPSRGPDEPIGAFHFSFGFAF